MRLSFVVPVYEPDLNIFERCVKSLVAQSWTDWDVTFVLDGPCNAARQIVNRVMKKSPNHFKIIEQERAGAQRARNRGGESATGDILSFWDCDSIMEPEVSRVWMEQFAEHPEIGFVYSGYKFLDEQGAVSSEKFDPWTLRVRNYISGHFPIRRQFYPGWNESLKSLQDWDFWLSALEKGAVGKYLEGYAFSTAYPTSKSISGQGCTKEVWLDRVNAVKKLHNLPDRDVCVSSLSNRHEGIWLAKLIDADYQDIPNEKPHPYKSIIQLGFSFLPGRVEHHSRIFNDNAKKYIFWTCDDVMEVCTRINLTAAWKYSTLLNAQARQFVEDKTAYDYMTKAGFKVEILPLPMKVDEVKPLPKRPRFAVDVDVNYNFIFEILQKSLPDVDLEMMGQKERLEDFTGLAHFYPDRTVSTAMKRAVLGGRAVVSNVQAPFMGFVDDNQPLDLFIPKAVSKIREIAYGGVPPRGRGYYSNLVDPTRLKEVLNAK